ncbi:MAG: hypothetical protein WCR52_20720 [Bacteroidota bacterium]
MAADKSSHILNTSSNLLGFCFFILTSIKMVDHQNETIIDESMAVAALIFMTASILSFLSIRSNNEKRSDWYESVADWFFITGLIILFFVILIITFHLAK